MLLSPFLGNTTLSSGTVVEVSRIGKFMEENIELLAFSVYFMLLCN